MKQIIVASDNHGHDESLKKILSMYPNATAFLHCGDSQQSSEELFPFISVKGNNDYLIQEEFKVLEIANQKIYITHGHKMFLSKDNMVARANKYHCNIFLYGHTHRPNYEYYRGVHLLNPGALSYPRGPMGETYAIISIDDNNEINVEIKEY